MTGPARSIARFAATLRYEDIPAAVRVLFVDTLRD